MEITIKAKSSSSDGFYNVKFFHEDHKLVVFCDCPAGIQGKFCKHKWELLNSNSDFLYVKNEKENLNQITNWVNESSFNGLYKKVNELEQLIEKTKAQLSVEKKNVEQRFREGF